MSEWKLKNLKDLSVSITSGLTPLKNNSEYWDNPVIPWLKTDQLGEKYIWDTNTKISEIALEKTSLKLYPPKTLSIAMYGEGKTRGNISIIMKPMATNQACCNIIINDEKADFEYVYYYMKTQYESLRGLSSGVRNNLNANDIKNYEIRIPESIVEQNNISKVLSVLDQKIAINNQINEELEAMAKTLYDYWFVQFNFPDENGKPYKSSGGKMVYNDQLKREIPEGWGVDSLWDIATFYNGLAMQKFRPASETDESLPVIKIREMFSGFSKDTEKASVDIPKDAIVESGDILFSWSATLEVMLWGGEKGALNQHIFKVTSEKYPKSFIYNELRSYLKVFKTIAELRKTTMGHITQDHLKQAMIIIPPSDLIDEMDDRISLVLKQQLDLKQQNQELTQLRDWLLPMLMNGQVKVEE
ncbi:TPA: restriction endonuclease subunit S [Streptococcus suis]|nr:restriction endonuclease subunit S [Streptococcus suis]HEM5100797.1 restriction endonuclease subunit S [Streptococcus suis]HEM5102313.1 restriction endonuclease subunit S [Streptococcus suis]HEM5108549.1 restriction endonuclease subunit S [Streptococcus suis]HEM5115329.1 restriction endonuclease subunit S [Streptococcus suis]